MVYKKVCKTFMPSKDMQAASLAFQVQAKRDNALLSVYTSANFVIFFGNTKESNKLFLPLHCIYQQS